MMLPWTVAGELSVGVLGLGSSKQAASDALQPITRVAPLPAMMFPSTVNPDEVAGTPPFRA